MGKAEKLAIEDAARNLFNETNGTSCRRKVLAIGTSSHEFDLFHETRVIGGVTTVPWRNGTAKATTNTGGQDRVSAELLWLSVWPGPERRVVILTDLEMAEGQLRKWGGCGFPHQIEILHFDPAQGMIQVVGKLASGSTLLP